MQCLLYKCFIRVLIQVGAHAFPSCKAVCCLNYVESCLLGYLSPRLVDACAFIVWCLAFFEIYFVFLSWLFQILPFRLEINEYDCFLNWIEIAAAILLYFDHLRFDLALIGWQLETLNLIMIAIAAVYCLSLSGIYFSLRIDAHF